ncbi:N-6 DNA methylase [Clostridium tyrobutyricum]|nr:N-6 DNA methylase [Clostridium tyrobutyricum]
MLEDIKLKTEEQNQFLGDLFEGFLDDGVKQSEGQFFTPLPIVKFLVSSLPLENIIRDNDEIPKTIDYACGAGHFLTEYASCIKTFVEKYKSIPVSDYYSEIYGIEKEYRLSKVSKVSAFMYGQDEIQIIYGDALAKNSKIKDNTFSVLISNPPYSVKGFLEMLTEEERNKFSLINVVSDISKNNSIETFFVERAKQLLVGGGVAAIVLPSSVLSNGTIYTYCREIILKYFDLIAIAELGSGTFGKTGTNTATLFMRRKYSNPDVSEHYMNRVNSWFEADYSKDIVFEDELYIDEYCKHCEIDTNEYQEWIRRGDIPSAEIFKAYCTKAEKSAKYKSIRKKKITKKYLDEDKERELMDYIDSFIREIEKEKIYYFLLAQNNPCQVVVLKSPSDKKEDKNKKLMKAFLGYEWSGAKGSEGIKYLGINSSEQDDEDYAIANNKGVNSINTPLFDPNDYENSVKVNTVIKNNFKNSFVDIPDELKQYVFAYDLVDMLDFSRVDFDKAIQTSGIRKTNFEIKSKYPIKKLDSIAKISRGASPRPIEDYITENDDGVNWIKIGDVAVGEKYITSTAQKITEAGAEKSRRVFPGDFIISNSMSVGRPYILKIEGCIHDGWLLMSEISSNIDKEYFYYVLSSDLAQNQLLDNARGGVVKNLNTTRVSAIRIPVPPMTVQKELVDKCNVIEAEINKLLVENTRYQNEIDSKLKTLYDNAKDSYKLSDENLFDISIGRRVLNREVSDKYTLPVYSANVYKPFGYINRKLLTDFSKPSVVWGIDGDWQVNVFPANYEFYPTDHCGVLRINRNELLPRYVAYALEHEGEERGFKRSYRASIDRIQSIQIKAPSLKEQKKAIDEISKFEVIIEDNLKKLSSLNMQKKNIIEKNTGIV